MKRILVIGAGASGMMAAIKAAVNGAQVTIYEKTYRVGKKILATGNGKCNLSNKDMQLSHFYCADYNKLADCFCRFSAEDTISFLARYVNKQDAITAANQFEDLVKKQSYLSEGIDFWVHMKNVFKTIIRYHICKADRIVSNNESTLNYADRFRNINYKKILLAQNKVSADDDKGFIWVLNTSVLLVPEYNISLVSDRSQ